MVVMPRDHAELMGTSAPGRRIVPGTSGDLGAGGVPSGDVC